MNDDWPRIMTDVDDDRPARDEEVEYCDYCGAPALKGDLVSHCGEKRCEDCRFMCPACEDKLVLGEGEVCQDCLSSTPDDWPTINDYNNMRKIARKYEEI